MADIQKAIVLDGCKYTTEDEKAFMEAICDAMAASNWQTHKLGDIKITDVSELCECDADAFFEALSQSPYALVTREVFDLDPDREPEIRETLLRKSAVADIFLRADETVSSGIHRLDDHREQLSRIYQKTAKKPVLILVRGNRIAAVHSDKYIPISQDAIFGMVQTYLTETVKGRFKYGFFHNEYSYAMYELEDEGLVAAYKDALSKAGLMGVDETIIGGLRVSTSDVGKNVVRLTPYIDRGGRIIQLGSPFDVKHVGTASVELVQEKLIMLFKRYTQTVAELCKLMSTTIEHPFGCLLNAGDKLRLPLKVLNDYVEGLERSGRIADGKPITAYECYEILGEVLVKSEEKTTTERFFALQESLFVALSFDWEEMDRAHVVRR